MRIARLLFAATLFCSIPTFADEPITFARFLVPLYQPPVHGAFGSLWEVSTWVRYTGQDGAVIMPRTGICEVLCPGVGGLISSDMAPQPLFAELASNGGLLMHVQADQASFFTFGSRVRDVSRDSESAGTEIPIVPEAAMLARPIELFDIRLGARMRDALRIYALPEVPAPEVDMRIYRWPIEYEPDRFTDAIELLAERRVALQQPQRLEGAFLFPSFAMIGNLDQLPELAGEEAVWIEIAPVTPGLRIWCMASMTNNETQQITLVTPQHD